MRRGFFHAPPAARVAYMRNMVSICKEVGIPWCVWDHLFSLVNDHAREFLSQALLRACLGEAVNGSSGQ